MPISLKDYAHLLPSAQPLKRKLSRATIAKLAKGFEKMKGGEPANSGVAKKIGTRMIQAAAEDAEKRLKK